MSKYQKLTVITVAVLMLTLGTILLYKYKSLGFSTFSNSASQSCTPLQFPVTKFQEIDQWLTYSNEQYGYIIDYPSILVFDPDSTQAEIEFSNYPLTIDVGVSDAEYYKNSLDFFLQEFYPTGMRLERKIKINNHDAIIVSNLPDREEKRDVLFAVIIKDKKLFSIRTQCVDHERIWNSFKFTDN